ncbi:DNA/RNA non-specific endonuclease [Thiospirochaeta perfilievii]|uniref:Endonuclease n=1 Tax=Thiospirochaeta perfilievii TaxID=252967 RepID=A0A5C1QBS7_9SPIO|nr:DNA/RNA non-specific endonuclease [Thiospirochaeta perfilievii]QEN03652.1 DNA/RNA non-specific endonuclease [Thiospirochaeta perfilievii]
MEYLNRIKLLVILLFTLSPIYSNNDFSPKATGRVFYKEFYSLQYNEEYEQADWVYYRLTKDMVYGDEKRRDSFKVDSDIETGSAALKDYKSSGFDRGHLVPAADMKISKKAMSESFYMSNMSPQRPGFNRGIWKKLESFVRFWAVENEELYIVTGPVFTEETYLTIGENRVGIPEYFYKVILDYKGEEIKAIGFLLPNKKSSIPIMKYALSVNDIEDLTGIDFFYNLPDDIEEFIEKDIDINLWPTDR